MIVVISDTHIFAGESALVNFLFDEGLEVFHLRKYQNSHNETEAFINKVKPEYRGRIVLHRFHEIAEKYKINRLHFSEEYRRKTGEEELQEWKRKGMILSASVHSVDAYNQLSSCFDYAFLSPVFDSISKSDYKARIFNLNLKANPSVALIALGGVGEENCNQALAMGFDGLALLGSIWKSNDPVERFRIISRKVTKISSKSQLNISPLSPEQK